MFFIVFRGGVPTEDLIQASIDADLWICKQNFTVKTSSPALTSDGTCPWVSMKSQVADGTFFGGGLRTRMLEEWSIYNYLPQPGETQADHFFATFSKFSSAK
eukprot:gene12342-12476_t